jgi:hypothetical protein
MGETHKFEVGQELAIYPNFSSVPVIRKIKSVSATGRATLENGTVVEPSLRIRGRSKWGPYSAEIVTPQTKEKVEKQKLIDQMRHETEWSKLSLLTLRTVAFVLEHSK